MSDAEQRAEYTPADGAHQMGLRYLHTGDRARVLTGDRALDPAAAIAVWPYYQADFDDPVHREDMTRQTKSHGTRVTFATEDGCRYAAVDWNHTEDAPILYLLVVDDPDPEPRRWDRVGEVQRIERYGEPVERSPEWIARPPSQDVEPWVAERRADPAFSGGDCCD